MQLVTLMVLMLFLTTLASGAKRRRSGLKKPHKRTVKRKPKLTGEPCAKLDPHVYDLCLNGRNNTRVEFTGSILQKRKHFREYTVCGCIKSTAVPGEDGIDDLMIAYSFGERHSYIPCGNLPAIGEISLCDGYWHHLCLTFSVSGGTQIFYADCGEGHGGFTIPLPVVDPGPDLTNAGDDEIIGSLGGQFDVTKDGDYFGCLTDFNFYEGILNEKQLLKNCRSCNNNNGDIIKWSDARGQLRGEVIPVRPSDALTKYDLRERCYKPTLRRIPRTGGYGYN